MTIADLRSRLLAGLATPAHPLALTASRRLDERRNGALTRYYLASGVGGMAVGVHTTQFAIRDPKVGFFEPVLTLVAEEMDRVSRPLVRVGRVAEQHRRLWKEAQILRELGYPRRAAESGRIAGCDAGGTDHPLPSGRGNHPHHRLLTSSQASADACFRIPFGVALRKSKTWWPSRWLLSTATRRWMSCTP